MRYAQIQSGRVINVIECPPDLSTWGGLQIVASQTAQIGDAYDGNAFTSAPAPRESVITVREFLDRMTIAKYSTLVAKAAADPVYAAWRDYLLAGGDVHLDADATVQGLAYAVSEGDLTSGDVTRIRGL